MPCEEWLFLSAALGTRTGVERQRKPEKEAVMSFNTRLADPGSLLTFSCMFLPPRASSFVSDQRYEALQWNKPQNLYLLKTFITGYFLPVSCSWLAHHMASQLCSPNRASSTGTEDENQGTKVGRKSLSWGCSQSLWKLVLTHPQWRCCYNPQLAEVLARRALDPEYKNWNRISTLANDSHLCSFF